MACSALLLPFKWGSVIGQQTVDSMLSVILKGKDYDKNIYEYNKQNVRPESENRRQIQIKKRDGARSGRDPDRDSGRDRDHFQR